MAALAVPIAHAQDTPAPDAGPVVVAPPPRAQQMQGVIPERFSIGPTPSLTPTPAPTPSPTPSAAATPERQAPAARATPVPRSTAPAAALPAPVASPASAPPASAPIATPSPLASVTPPSQPVATTAPVAEPAPATPPWLWALAGAGVTTLIGIGAWLLLRRRRDEEEEEILEAAPVAAAPSPPPPPPPVQPPPGLQRPAPVPPGADPFELVLNPGRITYGEREVLLEFELLVGNASGAAAENIRVAFAAMSAHAGQDGMIAGFHAGPPGEAAGQPFALAAGGGGRMPVRLAIPREGVNVVQVGGRPMFVPIVLIDLRWRGGLSVRRFGADFMLGTAGQGDKLGPLWLDRPAPTGPLAATRYRPRDAIAA